MNALDAILRATASLLLLAAVAGCSGGGFAADGGPIGTGITASVAGNVVAVVASSDTEQATPLALPEVDVSIDETPGLATTTDAEGNFALDGDFAGEVTVRFRSGDVEATQVVDVPTGALVVLADVVVSPGRIEAEAGRQVGFLGRVLEADCTGRVLLVEDERREARQFLVQLIDDTRIVRRDGSAATCAEAATGERIAIDGVFAPDSGTGSDVTALSITIGAERGARPDVVEDVPFAGFAAVVRCSEGTLIVADDEQRTRLRVGADTMITDRSGAQLGCGAIAVGDRVAGLGRLRVRQAGAIAATRIVVARGPGSADVRIAGAVVGTDCARGVLQLDDGDGVVAVLIGADTVVEPALTCDEILSGSRVRGVGRVRPAEPEIILALRLQVRRPAR